MSNIDIPPGFGIPMVNLADKLLPVPTMVALDERYAASVIAEVATAADELSQATAVTVNDGRLSESTLMDTIDSGIENSAYIPSTFVKRRPTVLNVLDYGASGGGVANDAAAINAALAAADAQGGASVYLPPGTYRLTNDLTIGSNTTLFGDGAISLLKPEFPSVRSSVIKNDLINGDTRITLRSFRLDRSGSNTQHGILLNGVDGLVIDGVEVFGVPSATSGAIAVSGVLPGGSGASRLESKNVRVSRCLIESGNNFGVQLSWVTNAVVIGNTFRDCFREAVGVEPELGCIARNITVSGNTFTTESSAGGTSTGVIVVTTSSGGTLDGAKVDSNTIINTNFTAANSNPGIVVLGANPNSKTSVTGNVITGMNGQGIVIGNATIATAGVIVANNTISDCNQGDNASFTGAGISLRQAINTSVLGNFIRGAKHISSVAESQAGTSNNQIAHNFLRDNIAVSLLAGSGSAVIDNVVGTSRRKTVAASATLLTSDALVAVTSTSSAVLLTLPPISAMSVGVVVSVVDESNAAGTNNITVQRAGSDTWLGGVTSKVISTNGGSLRYYSNGTNWVQA